MQYNLSVFKQQKNIQKFDDVKINVSRGCERNCKPFYDSITGRGTTIYCCNNTNLCNRSICNRIGKSISYLLLIELILELNME